MKQKLFSILTLLLGVCSGAWGQSVIFSAEPTAVSSDVTLGNGTEVLTAAQATVTGGTLSMVNTDTSTRTYITKSAGPSGNKKTVFTIAANKSSFKVTLSQALSVGDVISVDYLYNNNVALWLSTATSRPSSAPSTAITLATTTSSAWNTTNSYTVEADDGLEGKTTFYFYRNSSTTHFTNIKIIRPAADTRTATTTSFASASGSADIADGIFPVLPTVTTTPVGLPVSYTSSNPAVAYVNAETGAVRLNGMGTATITASFAGDEDNKPSSGTYELTVSNTATFSIYSWESDGTASETGGTATAKDETSVNYANTTYYVIRLTGSSSFSDEGTKGVVVELTNPLRAGDVIRVTAYRNKNASNPVSGFKAKFNIGSSTVSSSTGLEFCNIDTSDSSADDTNRGTVPNTCTFNVPADAAGSTVMTMTRSHTATNLYITKLEILRGSETVTISDAEWASFSNAHELAIPEGVTAYYARLNDGSSVTLSPITGGYIPANTGVVVSGSEGTYNALVTATGATLPTTNFLRPWLTAGTPGDATYYTLGVDAGTPVFKLSTGGVLAAGKAYLAAIAEARVLNVSFDEDGGETTGIAEMKETTRNHEFYNLRGQRVAKPANGLYIVNGKKVIVK